MTPRLLDKLNAIQNNPSCKEFILADARDADMAWGVASGGPRDHDNPSAGYVTLPEFLDEIRAVVEQGHIDILLASASVMSRLAHEERLFENTDVTPAARMNDTSEVWAVRGGRYHEKPSRPFSSAYIEEVQHGSLSAAAGLKNSTNVQPVVNLGLYSVTFNHSVEHDHRTLSAFRAFRAEAELLGFNYFLEVFAPNVDCGLAEEDIPHFVNDHIVRMLAGVPRGGRPVFLKMPYFGRAAMEELVAYDPSVVVGVLGGSSGTTLDAFALIEQAKRAGARIALFGRKIKNAEDPLAFIECLRRIADDDLHAEEGVRVYHSELAKRGAVPRRSIEDDLQFTTGALMQYAG